jgi:hypothetical protein
MLVANTGMACSWKRKAVNDIFITNRLSIFCRGKRISFGLGIIILQGVSSRKSLAGVNIMLQ